MFWASFNNAPRRIQDGGWAREVTQSDFQISETIAGVNMRLTRGGIREMHWHLARRVGYVTNGICRITTIDQIGRANVEDVQRERALVFPAGLPHSLQGIGEDGCEFIICFDDGKASEFNTLLLTEWMAHTPPDILALNFGVPAETFSTMPMHDLYIFQGKHARADRGRAGSRRKAMPGRPSCARSSPWEVAPVARDARRRGAHRRQQQFRNLQDDRRGAGDASIPAACAKCTGTPTPTSGSTSSPAKAS